MAMRERTALRTSIAHTVGLGLLMAWANITFFSGLIHFSTRNSITHLNSTYAFYCLGMAIALITLSLPIWTGKSPKQPKKSKTDKASDKVDGSRPLAWKRILWICALVLALCTSLLVCVQMELFKQPWCSIISTIAGLASGCLMLAWAQALLGEERMRLPWMLSLSFVMGGALYLLVLILPKVVAISLTVVFPVASVAVLTIAVRSNRSSDNAAGDGSAQNDDSDLYADVFEPRPGEDNRWWTFNAQGITPELRRRRIRFLRALASMLLLGFAESLERALFMSFSPMTESFANHAVLFLSSVIGAGTFALIVAGCLKGGREYRLNRAVTLVISFLFLLAPIVSGIWLWSDVATLTCHFLFQLLVWSVFIRMGTEYRLPARLCFAPGMGIASLGCLAGNFLGSIIRSFLVPTYQTISLLALICACLAMASLLFLFDEQTLVVLTNADTQRPLAPRRFGVRIDEVALKYGLTARELQVLTLIAKGRTTQRVQEELGISAGTVNTHLDHIYKKLDVHDRQQLLDLLEEKGMTRGQVICHKYDK